MDDIIHELNGATVFSKLDLTAGYHQLELHPDSRYISTFITHLGLRRYKRLNFGISSAAEVFQNAICQTLQGISGVKNLSDDIIVHGKTQADQNNSLRAVFQRLKERGLTLNRKKCVFNKSKLEFFGFIFSADPKKSYTKKDTIWHWGPEEAKALQVIKGSLTNDTVMSYFDPSKETKLIVDASPVGLGAILYRRNKEGGRRTIAYLSHALSDVERCYSQTEREALAIVWGCEHFHLYLYGNPFTLVTDHKALEVIWNNPRSKPPVSIERWGLRLQPYNFRVEYRKGAENPADYVSRHPVPMQTGERTRAEKVAEEYVNFVAQHATPKAMTLAEIQDETLIESCRRSVPTSETIHGTKSQLTHNMLLH
ncbi:hypothetical protein SKAU_G00279620 [Synaphobranchus kaupii]|uniref:ribonuclease H n=1 Tax=Synaphobranchus kaupii TaxID=118154 RepID=A0A9Q1EWU6_SYNKA|nr:hypothetical protein SKAU_G00279620 [Synaphobranchus kaupii]